MKLRRFTGIALSLIMSISCLNVSFAEELSTNNSVSVSAAESTATLEASSNSVSVNAAEVTATSELSSDNFVSVSAAELTATPESSFIFDLSTGTVTGFTGSERDIVIPSSIGGVEVKVIGEKAFYSCKGIKSVVIPTVVTKIAISAFAYSTNMTNVNIPNTVKIIAGSAFYGCSEITFVKG